MTLQKGQAAQSHPEPILTCTVVCFLTVERKVEVSCPCDPPPALSSPPTSAPQSRPPGRQAARSPRNPGRVGLKVTVPCAGLKDEEHRGSRPRGTQAWPSVQVSGLTGPTCMVPSIAHLPLAEGGRGSCMSHCGEEITETPLALGS